MHRIGHALRILTAALVVFGAFVASGGEAAAQGYSGVWRTGGCTLRLDAPGPFGTGRAETNFCSGELAFASQWRQTPGGVAVLTATNRVVANLSWDGRRLVGPGYAFSRGGGGGGDALGGGFGPQFDIPNPFETPRQARPQAQPPQFPGGGCIRYGRNGGCVAGADLDVPNTIPRNADYDGRSAQVRVLVNVPFRARIGGDQPIHFRFVPGTCIPIYSCWDRGGTPWCHSRLNGRSGYIAKHTVQNGRIQHINFTNSCTQGEGG